jgi:uncharacterized protein (DUF885 family)
MRGRIPQMLDPVVMDDASQTLATLADDYWDAFLAAEPLWASALGDHRFDADLPDRSRAAEEARIAALEEFARRAAALDDGALSAQERVSRDVLVFEATSEADALRSRLAEFAVAPSFVGPQADLLQLPLILTVTSAEDADAYVARLRRTDAYLGHACDRLRDGVGAGRTPPRVAVDQVVTQLDEYLAAPVDADAFLTLAAPSGWDEARTQRWRAAIRTAVVEVVRPALAAYRDCLADDVAPQARPPERSGVVWLPDGEEVYARAVRRQTTLTIDPDEVHALGLEAIGDLRGEYRELGARVLGTDDLGGIFTRLRTDPALRFDTGDAVKSKAAEALARAQAAVPQWFGRLPETPCVVREMAAFEVKDGTIAYYMPPAVDGSRPGIYYVNTYAPETRTRFEAEALAFHEAVPGHHLQIALAQELDDLPVFRRHALVNAYVEGWALYVERLADEMGLYSGDLERFGMLSFDSWRAGRLVVDTGLHHLGWSRDQAIAYLRDNSPQAENNIANEVDRYIAWPAQALGYKLGQREILRLRAEAERALGDAFDLPAFHDAVLAHGPVPLELLGDLVHASLRA